MFSFLKIFASRDDLAEWWEIGVVAAMIAGFGGIIMAFVGGFIALMGHLAQDSPDPPEPSVPKSAHDYALETNREVTLRLTDNRYVQDGEPVAVAVEVEETTAEEVKEEEVKE